MSQSVGSRERFIEFDTAAITTTPTRDTAPHIVVSPRTPAGALTGSLTLTLAEPDTGAASPAPGGFNLTLYRATTLGQWATFQTFEGLNFNELLVLNDLSGAIALYFLLENVGTPGLVLAGIAEQA